MKKKVLKRTSIALLTVVALAVVIAGGYVAYLFATYSRLEDNLSLEVAGAAEQAAPVGEPVSIVTWNLGFGAYSADYSFFMDGGIESRAYSAEAVRENIGAMLDALAGLDPDLALLQEIDVDATRSHHIDESALVTEAFPERDAVFAQNYDSAYLFYPLTEPHGASRAGQMTLSRFGIDSALRRSLPIETGVMKFFDLDRCYSVSRIPTENGLELCLYNLHLSAYTSDGSIVAEQLDMLLSDMAGEAAAGNYAVAGGDFNMDLLGNSAEVFGVSGENYTWAQPFPTELLPEGISLVSSLDADAPVASCRNADRPYEPGTSFTLTVDGFLVSDNVTVLGCEVVDEGFAHSDHNPVQMTFLLGE